MHSSLRFWNHREAQENPAMESIKSKSKLLNKNHIPTSKQRNVCFLARTFKG
jgi:hypothetical protein